MDSAFAFVFPKGKRPDQAFVQSLFAEDREDGFPARLSHFPPAHEGWVEILASGLTFDLDHLAPAPGLPFHPAPHAYGFQNEEARVPLSDSEAISLRPAGHIAGGAALAPVIRTMAGLAASLALHLPVKAIAWPPARSVMDPVYFARMVMNWLGGGAFPALGLTSLASAPDGSVASLGLSFFCGAEMQLEAGDKNDPQADMKLAVRVVDYLVGQGVPDKGQEVRIAGETLIMEPARQGRRLWVWRSA